MATAVSTVQKRSSSERLDRAWSHLLVIAGERSENPITALNQEARMIGGNTAFCDMTGIDFDNLPGLRLAEICEPADSAEEWWSEFTSKRSMRGRLPIRQARQGGVRPRLVSFDVVPDIVTGISLLTFCSLDHQPETNHDASTLSDREVEVLRHISNGEQGDEIAQRMFISTETVRSHTKNARAKLHARTRAEAVSIAIRAGLI